VGTTAAIVEKQFQEAVAHVMAGGGSGAPSLKLRPELIWDKGALLRREGVLAAVKKHATEDQQTARLAGLLKIFESGVKHALTSTAVTTGYAEIKLDRDSGNFIEPVLVGSLAAVAGSTPCRTSFKFTKVVDAVHALTMMDGSTMGRNFKGFTSKDKGQLDQLTESEVTHLQMSSPVEWPPSVKSFIFTLVSEASPMYLHISRTALFTTFILRFKKGGFKRSTPASKFEVVSQARPKRAAA
jgi:hypothetical protein